VISNPRVPLYWLEIRWTGSAWAWRPLGADDRTRGPGQALQHGWRRWSQAPDRSRAIYLDEQISVTIVDAVAPGPVLEDFYTGQRLEGDELLAHLEWRRDGLSAIQDDGVGEILGDGAIVDLPCGPSRLWLPGCWHPTVMGGVDIGATDCTVDVDLVRLEAVFTRGRHAVTIKGECVRLLAAYMLARRDDPRDSQCGFRNTTDVHNAWVKLGANTQSAPDRVAWERSRIRSRLVQQGARNVGALFERKRVGCTWYVRLSIAPAQLVIVGQSHGVDDQ